MPIKIYGIVFVVACIGVLIAHKTDDDIYTEGDEFGRFVLFIFTFVIIPVVALLDIIGIL